MIGGACPERFPCRLGKCSAFKRSGLHTKAELRIGLRHPKPKAGTPGSSGRRIERRVVVVLPFAGAFRHPKCPMWLQTCRSRRQRIRCATAIRRILAAHQLPPLRTNRALQLCPRSSMSLFSRHRGIGVGDRWLDGGRCTPQMPKPGASRRSKPVRDMTEPGSGLTTIEPHLKCWEGRSNSLPTHHPTSRAEMLLCSCRLCL